MFRVDLAYRITVYEAMVSKIVALLTCTPEEFDSGELYFDYGLGCYQVRIPYDDDFEDFDEEGGGPGATNRHEADSQHSYSPNLIQRILNWF